MDAIWTVIDEQRERVADLFAGLTDDQWAHRSLCAGWSVRDVGAHLTLQSQSVGQVLFSAMRHPGSLNGVIARSAQATARSLTTDQIVERQRALIGNHRPNAFVTPNETLVDIVVHGLDVAVPLGIDIEVPDATALRVIELLQGYRGTSKQKVFGPIVAEPDESADQRQQILALSGRTHP